MSDKPVHVPVDGILDLHAFRPGEVLSVVDEYLRACREAGLLQVRIIHGKGKGVQRNAVREFLKKQHFVVSVRGAEETGGGWGATIVNMLPPGES